MTILDGNSYTQLDFLNILEVLRTAGSITVKRQASDGGSTFGNVSILGQTATDSEYEITISSADIAVEGKIFIINDESGGAGTNNIVILTEGSESIDGSTDIIIAVNYGSQRLYSDGSNLFTW